MAWYLSPDGWPQWADENTEYEKRLIRQGYVGITEGQVAPALAAFNGGKPYVATPGQQRVMPGRYLTEVEGRAAFVPFWAPSEVVPQGAVRMTALGLTITRNTAGTTRASYDATEAALWTVSSGSGGGGTGYLPGQTDKIRVLVVGSSNAAGEAVSPLTNGWVGQLASALSATHTFFNDAISGQSPSYWLTADGTGRSPMEQAILNRRPHIVIGAFTAQNGGGPAPAFLGFINQAINLCHRYGLRYVGITPYISNGYSATARDENKRLASVLRRKGIPLLDFATIWGTAATIPASIDSGDGLHLNLAGHTEQKNQVPADYLSTDADLPRAPRFTFVGSGPGLTIPAGASGGAPLLTTAHPAGSWTVGFDITIASANAIALLTFGGNNNAARMRVGATTPGAVDMAGGIVHPTQAAFTVGTAHHIALSYNAITLESVLYLDGVATSTVTATSGQTYTSVALGANYPGNANYATGYTFRNLTVHATALDREDVSRLARGVVPMSNVVLAAALDDAVARPVGGAFAALIGQAIRAATQIALP